MHMPSYHVEDVYLIGGSNNCMNQQAHYQYLKDLLHWTESTYKHLLESNQFDMRTSQSPFQEETERLMNDIRDFQEKPVYTVTNDEVASLYERASRIYDYVYEEREGVLLEENTQENNEEESLQCEWEQEEDERFAEKAIRPLDPVPIGGHTLPPLPYNYDALEPYISEDIMRLHHLEHHQTYVDGLNEAERNMAEARRTGDYDLIRHWQREAAFHGAGHYLHTMFWKNMSPKGGGTPTGTLAEQINRNFGSFETFKEHFSEAANEVEGVGWAILVWAPRAHRLEILQAEKHQLLSQWDVIPLLALDVWEHAYYLQYPNNREEYVDQWWNVVNWDHVQSRFNVARNVRWQTYK